MSFKQKIHQIHLHLGSSSSLSFSPEPCLTSHSFFFFQLPSDSDVSDFILKFKPSTCHLDPLPTVLVKACLPSLFPLISAIIHSSLSTGIVPTLFKTAAVTPMLKKPGAYPTNYNNLRPISNLPFHSKILEKTVASQIHCHLTLNNLSNQFHSGFRLLHNTESVLIKITNDLLLAADSGLLTILILQFSIPSLTLSSLTD